MGHIRKSQKLEHVLTTGKNCVKRDRESERGEIIDSHLAWHGDVSAYELITVAGDHMICRSMIANPVGRALYCDIIIL